MQYNVVVYGKFPGMNEYTSANRTNCYKGAKMKRDAQNICCAAIYEQLRGLRLKKPVRLSYLFVEENKRRDHDNVQSFFQKVFQDALVEAKVLKDDGWDEIVGNDNAYTIDKRQPRVEITITEV